MPAIYNQILVQYLDGNGKEGTSFWPATDQTTIPPSAVTALAAKVQALTNCAVIGMQFQSSYTLTATPTDGPYKTIVDRVMVLSKIVATQKPFTFEIPGPKSTIFTGDTMTLNLANTDVIALQTAMMPNVGDNQGNPIGPFRRGYRTEAKGSA
jgi:hypothetical protein